MSGMNLEIWFPQQDEVTVFLESAFTDPEDEQIHETSLFALYAARQIANLRQEGLSLAMVLASIDTSNPLADVESRLDGELRISSPRFKSGARKGFTAELRPDSRAFFKLQPHGFGMLGKGVGYYAPTSTLALLCWLLRRRADDSTYQRALAATAENIGIAGSQGMISVTAQAQVAMQAAAAAWGEAYEAQQFAGLELSPEAEAAAAANGIAVGELLAEASQRLSEAVEDIEGEGVMVLPDHASLRFSRTQVVLAAGLVDEEDHPLLLAIRAQQAAEETGNDEMIASAQAHHDRELERLIDEHGLVPVVNELHELLFTLDPDRAAGR